MAHESVIADPGAAGVRIERRGASLWVMLDRPSALNAIDNAMRKRLAEAIRSVARDPNIYGVILEAAGERAFSVGGDVREILALHQADPVAAASALADEYALNWLLECFSKPTIALINGLVMGTGVGVSLYATHRVAGPHYAFAMPETAIGFFPDDGVAHALARLPDHIGMYLALTGRRIGRADAYCLGLVTHCIDPDRFALIRTRLADADTIDPLLDPLHADPGASELEPVHKTIAHCFGADSVKGILDRLTARSRTDGADAAWCAAVSAELRQKSPLALSVTFRHVREARALDLRQVLMVDHRLACRLVAAPDFAEGVRAQLIDKDRKPRWQPGRIEDVTAARVESCFAPMPGALVLPTRQEMQAQRV